MITVGKRVFNAAAPYQSISNAARISGFSTYYIRNGCKDGSIPHVMCGNEYRINMGRWYELLNVSAAENGGEGDSFEETSE